MAAITPTAGSSLNATPSPIQAAIATNYLDFHGTAGTTTDTTWAQQYLPDLIEKEAEVFGKRTISGFLNQVGAEESMASDQVIWSEQGRLHLSYKSTGVNTSTGVVTISGVVGTTDTASFSANGHSLRVGQTVVISDGAASPYVVKAYVSNAGTNTTCTVVPYADTWADIATAGFDNSSANIRLFAYGSEFIKGQSGMAGDPVQPEFKSYTNKPIILKDKYAVSGSDTSRIGWVEVASEEGASGYLWYLKAESDTRARFNDSLEMAMVESEKGVAAQSIIDSTLGSAGDETGSEGLFAAIKSRGHYTSGIGGTSASDDLGSFDEILKKFDEQGAIEEYMLYVNRDVSLAIDDMLAAQNSYGSGGTSYGVFNNSEDMALNLGFSGFRRGSYDFYKTDWKYLNDATLRGQTAFNKAGGEGTVRGVLIPAGVSSVYDEVLGRNLRRPFLHVRYRASNIDNRKLKTWITGSVGGNITSDLDAMEVHYLSERCLVVQGANNFMLLN